MLENLVPNGIYCVPIPAPILAQGMIELSASELRVLLYIYLHTLGYKKSEDYLTYDQFLTGVKTREGVQIDKGAGVSRRSLVTALAGLEEKGYIKREHAVTGGAKAATITISKIRLVFTAKEFQITHQLPNNKNTANKVNQNQQQTFQQNQYPSQKETGGEVQNLHCRAEQNLHLSCMNHLKNHGGGEDSTDNVTNDIISNKANTPKDDNISTLNNSEHKNISTQDLQAAIFYLMQNIPYLAETDAKRLATIALVKHGRNLGYLKQLTTYILSHPKIQTPAAVLTTLVIQNSTRVAQSPTPLHYNTTGKNKAKTRTNGMAVFSREKSGKKTITTTMPQKTKSFPFALQHLQKDKTTPSNLPTGHLSLSNLAITNKMSDLPTLELQSASPSELPTLPTPSATLTPLSFDAIEALKHLQADISGRFRYSVSSQLPTLIKNFYLELWSLPDDQKPIIKLGFHDGVTQRLLAPQDYQLIRLSLRQYFGDDFIIDCASKSISAYEPDYESAYEPTTENLLQYAV